MKKLVLILVLLAPLAAVAQKKFWLDYNIGINRNSISGRGGRVSTEFLKGRGVMVCGTLEYEIHAKYSVSAGLMLKVFGIELHDNDPYPTCILLSATYT